MGSLLFRSGLIFDFIRRLPYLSIMNDSIDLIILAAQVVVSLGATVILGVIIFKL